MVILPQKPWRVEGKTAPRCIKNRAAELALAGLAAHTLPCFCHVSLRTPGAGALDLSTDDTAELEAELARLRQEHRDLDTAIEALEQMVAGDQLQIQRLKKRKLSLKDQIRRLEDQLTPDIIA
jgi:hypothetical protein